MSCLPAPSKSLETGPLTVREIDDVPWITYARRAPGRENLITDTFPGPLYPDEEAGNAQR